MRLFAQSALIVSIVAGSSAFATAQATKSAPTDPRAATKPAKPSRPAILDQVLATVNGEPIIRDDLYRLLQDTGTPPGASLDEDQDIYQKTIEQLINSRLLKQYLKKQAALAVTEKEVDAEFATFADQFKKDGQDVYVALASHGVTVAQVRDDMAAAIRFRKYIEAVATDAALKKFVAENKDVFHRNQVRASQIQLILDQKSTAADKEKAKQRLLAIKQEIESKKISFADAANKYSEDDNNKKTPRGGDVGFFFRQGLIEELAAPAFAMKVGMISGPIESPYGMHLLMVTDRKDGTPVDFEQNKLQIRNEYAADLHERIIASERKTAKITIEKMPADFFPKSTPTPTAPAGTGTGAAKAATPK